MFGQKLYFEKSQDAQPNIIISELMNIPIKPAVQNLDIEYSSTISVADVL